MDNVDSLREKLFESSQTLNALTEKVDVNVLKDNMSTIK